MPVEISAADVQALSPDSSSAAAGKKLARATQWKSIGYSERALWGECQGSALYQTQVALVDLVTKCSCPSRKFPCKHALGLLFLAADAPHTVPSAEEPEWVSSWFQKRGAALEKKQSRAADRAARPADAVAQAKRAEKRHDNVLDGIEQLDAWMNDLVRQGLGRLQSESPSFWDQQARRLVDAQAPGLSGRVRKLGRIVGERGDWGARLLAELGLLTLLTQAYRRVAELEPPLAADVRRLVGFTLEQAEVLAGGDVVEDEWTVLAERTFDEERMRTQRAWLRGTASGRTAMVLQFAVGTGRFAEALFPATRFRGKLAFWPSACPQRALVAERSSQAEPVSSAPKGDAIATSIDRFSSMIASMPWLERELFVLEDVVPVVLDETPDSRGVGVLDAADACLPLGGGDPDVLIAVSGGHPLVLVGEWNGHLLSPLVAWEGSRKVTLTRRSA